MMAAHLQGVHPAYAVIGMLAAAAGDFPGAELVHEIRIVDKGPGHLKSLKTGIQHLLHLFPGNEAADIDERQLDRLTELLGIIE